MQSGKRLEILDVKFQLRLEIVSEIILHKQEHKCAICGIDSVWQGKPLNFILDHINGDASNNWEYNLRLICPNCDSQLDTYKSKNKNSARTHRKKYQGSMPEPG